MALIGVGLLIVLFLVYLFAFTPLTASRNQQRLAQSVIGQPLFRYRLVAGHVPPEGPRWPCSQIPALHLDQVVVQGTSAADLMNGPGLMPGIGAPRHPGQRGHRRATGDLRRPLRLARPTEAGDRIHAVDGAGTFTYRVTKLEVVTAGQQDVVTPTTDNRLTLITSNSTVLASGRLVVLATAGRAARWPSEPAWWPSPPTSWA